MSNKQLYEKENNINKPFFPIVKLEDIIDTISEKSIQWILNNYNHIYVEWKNDVVGTRLSVPTILRRNGLWITYNNGDKLITEYYIGKNTEIKDKHWQDDANWEDYTNKLIDGTVEYRHLSESLKQLFNKGNVTNFPDEEDLTSDGVALSFKDREYQPENFSGLGRVILRKNIINVGEEYKNILTQSMINKENTIYEIRYDFDLDDKEITVPKGCVLDFQGGSLSNGSIYFTYSNITGMPSFTNIDFKGSVTNLKLYFSWFNEVNDTQSTIKFLKACSDLNNNAVFNKSITLRASETKNQKIIAACNIDFGNNIISFDNDVDNCYIEIINNKENYIINDKESLTYLNEIIKGNKSRNLKLEEVPINLKNISQKLLLLEYPLNYRTENNIECKRQTHNHVIYKKEFIYVDEFHNIIGDFYNSSFDINGLEITVIEANSTPIIIKNGIFKTITSAYNNGIKISRSNTTIENIFIDNQDNLLTHITCNYCYNIIIKNINYNQYNSNAEGTYLLLFDFVIKLIIDSCKTSGIVDTTAGQIASNYISDLKIFNSIFNRIDCHYRLTDLHIDNSVIGWWGITYHGSGNIIVSNSTFISNYILYPRADYGGDFNGNIILENITWKTKHETSNFYRHFSSIIKIAPIMADTHPNNPDYDYWIGAKNLYVKNLKVEKYDKSELSDICVVSIGFQNPTLPKKHFPNIYIDTINFEQDINFYTIYVVDSFKDIFKFQQNDNSNINNYTEDLQNPNIYPNVVFEFKNINFPKPLSRASAYMEYFNNIITVTEENYQLMINEEINGETAQGLKILPHYYYYNCKNVRLGSLIRNAFISTIDSEITSSIVFVNDYKTHNHIYCFNSKIIAEADTAGGVSGNYNQFKTAKFISCIFDISDYVSTISNSNLTNAVVRSFLTGEINYSPSFLRAKNYLNIGCTLGYNLIKNWYIVNARLNLYNYVKVPINLIYYYINQIPFAILTEEDLIVTKLDNNILQAYSSSDNKPIWWTGSKWVDANGQEV